MATAGYQAGFETTDTLISYGPEVTWGTVPAVAFQAIRYTGETLGGTKTRQAVPEINANGEQSYSTTTQESASGAINYALSYGTFDDFIASAMGNPWQAAQAIAGVAGDITLTTSTNVLSSTTAGKFTNVAIGQWVRLLGFTNVVNNVIARVVAKASAQSITLSTPASAFVTETPTGTNAQVRASTLSNGTVFQSLYLQNKFSSSVFLRYPGAFVSGMTLTASLGGFIGGAFNIIAQAETSATTDASTGSVVVAPSGRVVDPIAGFGGVFMDGTAVAAVVDNLSLNITRSGAAGEYGLGNAQAQGMLRGTLGVTGTLRMYFRDLTYYTRFKNETLGVLSFILRDPAGNAYVVTLLAAALINPKIDSTAPGAAVMAEFTIEGNPQTGGGTIQFDRLPAV